MFSEATNCNEEDFAYREIEKLSNAVHNFTYRCTEGTISESLAVHFFTAIDIIESFKGHPDYLELHCEKVSKTLIDAFVAELHRISTKRNSDLESIVPKFINFASACEHNPKSVYMIGDSPKSIYTGLARILYTLCKVAAPKILHNALPSKPEILIPVLEECLIRSMQAHDNHYEWELIYVLTVWLAILVRVPFPLTLYHRYTIQGLFALCKHQWRLNYTRKCTADLSVAFFIRSDTRPYFNDFILSFDNRKALNFEEYSSDSLYSFLAHILKRIPNIIDKVHMPIITTLMKEAMDRKLSHTKYAMKFLTHAAIYFIQASQQEAFHQYWCDHFDIDGILNLALDKLSDKSSELRYLAAKCIALIAENLTETHITIIFARIQRCFTNEANDKLWHGGILALAALIRRRMCLPYVGKMLSVITEALHFDVQKNESTGVGSNVRDAACFLTWTIARVGSKRVINQAVELISNDLLFRVCFDREIMVRRAASAAYQELVGRHGATAVEIKNVQVGNFFVVANMTNAFTIIAKDLAQLCPSVQLFFIKRLCHYHIFHWDTEVRKLAADALGRLMSFGNVISKKYILFLIEEAVNPLYQHRHGALCALSSILNHTTADEKNITFWKNVPEVCSALVSLDIPLEAFAASKRKGQQELYIAICFLFQSLSQATCIQSDIYERLLQSAGGKNHRRICLDIILLFVFSTSDEVADAASAALGAFVEAFYSREQDTVGRSNLMKIWVSKTAQPLVARHRHGYMRIFKSLPTVFMEKQLGHVIDVVIACIHGDFPAIDIETKKLAVDALVSVCEKNFSSLSHEKLQDIVDAVFLALRDYTSDYRGDIGSILRKSAAMGIVQILKLMEPNSSRFKEIYIYSIKSAFGNLLTQFFSKLDSVRALSHSLLEDVFFLAKKSVNASSKNMIEIYGIPHSLEENFFRRSQEVALKMSNKAVPFASFAPCLNLLGEAYYLCAVEGIIDSYASLSEHVVNDCEDFVQSYMSNSLMNVLRFGSAICQILQGNRKAFRVVHACFKTLCFLHKSGKTFTPIEEIISSEFSFAMSHFGRHIHKVLQIASVFTILFTAQSDLVCRQAVFIALRQLRWEVYPLVRSRIAETLRVHIISLLHFVPKEYANEVEECFMLAWFSDDSVFRGELESAREKLCKIFKVDFSPSQEGVSRSTPKISNVHFELVL